MISALTNSEVVANMTAKSLSEVSQKLASALTTEPPRRKEVADRLVRVASSDGGTQYQALNVLETADDLIVAAKPYAQCRLVTAFSDSHSSTGRKLALGCMYAAVMGTSWEDGQDAVLRARQVSGERLAAALMGDAANVVQTMIQLGVVSGATAAGLGYTATAASAAWAAGGAAGTAKAAAWGLGFGAVAFSGGLLSYGVLCNAKDNFDDNSEDRRTAFTSEYGKDLLFAEMLVGSHVPFQRAPSYTYTETRTTTSWGERRPY